MADPLDSLSGPAPSWQPNVPGNSPNIGDSLEAPAPTELSGELRSIKANARVLSLDPAWVNFEGCADPNFCPSPDKAVRAPNNSFTLTGDWTVPLPSGRPAIAQIGRRVRITLESGTRFVATVAAVIAGGVTTVTITGGGLINLDPIATLEWGLLVPNETPSWLDFTTVQLGGVAALTVAAGGTGYALNDELTIVGGNNAARVRVTAVAGDAASAVLLIAPGTGYAADTAGSTHATLAVAPATGTGCTVSITSLTSPVSTAFVVPVSQGGTGRVDTGAGGTNATALQGTPIAPTAPTPLDVLGLSAPQAIMTITAVPAAADAGAGYVASDILHVVGGDGMATVRVDTVDGTGAVTHLTLTFAGSGYTVGPKATTGGSGVGCTVTVGSVGGPSQWQSTALALLLQVPQVVAANPGAFTVSTLSAGPKLLVRFGQTNQLAIPAGGTVGVSIDWSALSPHFASGSFYVAFATATQQSVVASVATAQDVQSGLFVTLRNVDAVLPAALCGAFVVAIGLAA